MPGRYAEMQLRRDAEFSCGAAVKPGDDEYRLRQYYGPCPHGQYHAFRRVPEHGEPDSCGCNRGGVWRIEANAVHPGDACSLGARLPDGADRPHART